MSAGAVAVAVSNTPSFVSHVLLATAAAAAAAAATCGLHRPTGRNIGACADLFPTAIADDDPKFGVTGSDSDKDRRYGECIQASLNRAEEA